MTVLMKMQRCSKFQSQSKILEKKVLVIIFSIVLISISPQVFADNYLDTLLAEKNAVQVEQQKIIFEVGRHSDVHVKHVIDTGAWNPDRPRLISIMPGQQSNLTVADEDGDRLNFSYDGETFEESKYIILNQKQGGIDLVAEYDLDNFMELKDGKWKKEIKTISDVMVMIEEDIEIIFVNSRPIDVSDARGINCIGCGITLEYFVSEEIFSEEIISTKGKFTMDVISNDKISNLEFIEGGMQLLNFNVENKDQLIILKIPFENFLNPYDVYFTENDDVNLDQLDKIRKTEFSQDETHVSISFRTNGEGTVSIVGATPEEHEKRIEQITKMKTSEVKSEIKEEKRGVPVPIPGTETYDLMKQQTNEEKMNELSFANELENEQEIVSGDGMISVAIIVGIIIVGIIGGIILKLKRN